MKHTIIVDQREKIPLLFPKAIPILAPSWTVESPPRGKMCLLNTRRATLITGDYALEGFQGLMLIERKGSISEVCKNCLTKEGRRKFVDCCKRLRDACDLPVLLIEGDLLSFIDAPPHTKVPPGAGLDALLRIIPEYGLKLLTLPRTTSAGRYTVGEWVARLLINTSLRKDAIECHLLSSTPLSDPTLPPPLREKLQPAHPSSSSTPTSKPTIEPPQDSSAPGL